MMDGPTWERVQALFHAALDLPEPDRTRFLETECAGDAALVVEVRALLEEDARGTSLLDRDVAHVAHAVLTGALAGVPPAETFGAYRIKGVLGEGGMGVVYLAERPDLGSLAAIKVLRDAWLSPARRERFSREQRTLAQLDHPLIARIYDADTLADGTPWFVMEYVDGVSLTEYCRARASAIPERLRLFRDVCGAVQHAHRHLIIHRDLKPSNIFVRRDGSVKLLDFGISKHLESLDATQDRTRTALRLMTPAYAAPEQLRGGSVGVHTDVYSLGVVLYELLVGRPPFDLSNVTPSEAESIILEREPDAPSVAAKRWTPVPDESAHTRSISRSAWGELDVLCLTSMHKDAQRRYRTVEALLRDVDHYLNGEPLEARPDSARYRIAKFIRRNWRPVSAAAAALAVIFSLTTFYTVRLAGARNAALAEAARTQRIQQFMLNLFQGGHDGVGPADSLRVLTLVERGVREARSLEHEPVIQAELYETLGTISQQLGNLPRGDSLLQAALDRRRSLFGQDHPDVAVSLVALGMLRGDQAELDEAERMVRQGLDMSARHLTPGHPAVARATTALGDILVRRGEYDQAIPVLEEAVRLQSAASAVTSDLSGAMTLLANAHFYAGRYAISDSLNQTVLAMDRQLFGDRHPNVADDLINLGAIRLEGGQYAEAEPYYREAADIMRSWHGADHPETASSLTALGRVLIPQQRLDEAAALLRQALAIQERVYGVVHPRVASALNELGRVAQQQGDLDAAEANFSRMTDIYREVYGDRHYYIGVALSNLAGVHHRRGAHARAEQLFRDVIRRYGEVLSADHQLVGIARIRLGGTLLAARRFAEAEAETLAGYENLSKQATPPAQWLDYAREDLAAVYDSLGQPEKASRFRAELPPPAN